MTQATRACVLFALAAVGLPATAQAPPGAPTMGTLGMLGLCAVLALIGASIVIRGRKHDDDEDE